ncbi:MAG TPA: chorismate-binding protein [Candidatus Baltobacteraceae bacterium]|jgi:para-aminobenzoate synthetase/4-amino-4-deoxychorismate lyase|nr:chorismate-binding protein [Candidatus Baltobacteraceae bacterium]
MTLRVAAGLDPAFVFENPSEVWAPETLDEAVRALARAEDAHRAGYWIAGALSYEFGAQLQGVDARTSRPLLLLGAYEACRKKALPQRRGRFSLSAPLRRISASQYGAAIAYILQQITDGEVYQVNYTVPFDAGFSGDPLALYTFLARRARVPYSAFLEYGDLAIASLSPELFLKFRGGYVMAKPMKGTAAVHRVAELGTEKNRAEHVMIVDLLRNDLQRIASGVCVPRLFEAEVYPTFATMTSTIRGRLRPRITLEEIFRATFPCGSVTGAPKRAALQHIARTELYERGFYTGTIGFLSPRGEGWWNVPIRTLQIDVHRGRARYDAGGGIVSDSSAQQEWEEILLKSRVLLPATRSFALLETFCADGEHAGDHLTRLHASASAFGIQVDDTALSTRLHECSDEHRLIRLRAGSDGVAVRAEPFEAPAQPVDICLSQFRIQSDDPFLRYKTAWRPAHDRAAREAAARGCFDAILQNERGELTEGSRTNLFIRIGGELLTPPLQSGVLPGILRGRLLAQNNVVERVVTQYDLAQADAIYVGNSARGLLLARIK